MAIAICQTMEALCAVVQSLPIGTNLALLHFLWMQLSGTLLLSRGALFPALQASGLFPAAVRRAWAAFHSGAWEIGELLSAWENYVRQQRQWQAHPYDGYYPKAVDLTAYWRPALKGCPSKHYYPPAEKALPAIVLGLIARVGSIHGQRVALITELVRIDPEAPSEAKLQTRVVLRAAETLADDEMPVFDAGFKIRELQEAGLDRYTVRWATNFTARRNVLPAYEGHGRRPEYGELVRPLARTRQGKRIPATPPDRVETWTERGIEFRAEWWDNLVLSNVKVHPDNPTFQFVFAPESCQRLPELNLLAGSIVTYLAVTLPATPTGFWDRDPKPTPGRLRRLLARTPFPESYPLPERLRKKDSVAEHLPKGILGHRRTKQAAST